MTASARSFYGPQILATEIGLQRWQFERADAAGMFPARGHMQGWLPDQLEQVRALVPAIVERFGAEHPLGATRCADRLAERVGLAVEASDVAALAAGGHLRVADVFSKKGRQYELFAPADIDGLKRELVAATVQGRLDWIASSLGFDEACTRLGWRREELDRVVADRGIERGRFGRIAREVVDDLAGDEGLDEQLRADRLVTADQAATEILDIERRHFDIAVEHSWVQPMRHHEKEVGRYRTVSVPLYRTGDVQALLERCDVDWEQVRATVRGAKSPLLEVVGGRKASRAKLIRSFLRWYGAEHGIEMWGWWVPGPDVWEIDWARIPGGPTKDDVEAAIEANPALHLHRGAMTLHSAAGAAIRFARGMLEPGAAVILDTETTDLYGAIVELAVIDACTGKTLLDTLVNPGDIAITAGAAAIHGLSDEDVHAEGVPDWPTVYKRLLRVTRNRRILAYNADYDHAVVTADCRRHGITRTRLADSTQWADVMVPRSDHAHSRRWLANGGSHRALGDTQQTRLHLQRMTAP